MNSDVLISDKTDYTSNLEPQYSALEQPYKLDSKGQDIITDMLRGYRPSDDFFTYDHLDDKRTSTAAGYGGVVTTDNPWSFLPWVEPSKKAVAYTDGPDSQFFKKLAPYLLTTPETLQTLWAVEEVAHKVTWPLFPAMSRQDAELFGEVARINYDRNVGFDIFLGRIIADDLPEHYSTMADIGAEALTEVYHQYTGKNLDKDSAIEKLGDEIEYAVEWGETASIGLHKFLFKNGIEPAEIPGFRQAFIDSVLQKMNARLDTIIP